MLDYVITVRTNYCDSNDVVQAYNVKTFITSGENALDLGFKGLYETYKYQIEKIKKHESGEYPNDKRTKLISKEYVRKGNIGSRAYIEFIEYGRIDIPNSESWYDHTTIEYDVDASNRIIFGEDGHVKVDEKILEENRENIIARMKEDIYIVTE